MKRLFKKMNTSSHTSCVIVLNSIELRLNVTPIILYRCKLTRHNVNELCNLIIHTIIKIHFYEIYTYMYANVEMCNRKNHTI